MIIFDLLGVITTEGMWATEIVFPIVSYSNINYDLFKKKYLLYSLGLINDDDFWEYICNKKDSILLEKKIIKKTHITPEINKIITYFKKKDFKIYLASEIPERWGKMILDKAKLTSMFDKTYFSSSVGLTKPFKKFYQYIYKDLSTADIIYYIDDSKINVLSAQTNMQAQSILYSPASAINNSKEINKITELFHIIK